MCSTMKRARNRVQSLEHEPHRSVARPPPQVRLASANGSGAYAAGVAMVVVK